MKSLLFMFCMFATIGVFAKNDEIMTSISDDVITKVNASNKDNNRIMSFVEGDCWFASGSVICHAPCRNGGGSDFNTGCRETAGSATQLAGELAGDICGSCEMTVTFEVSNE